MLVDAWWRVQVTDDARPVPPSVESWSVHLPCDVGVFWGLGWHSPPRRFPETASVVWLGPLPDSPAPANAPDAPPGRPTPLLLHGADAAIATLLHAGEVIALFEPEVGASPARTEPPNAWKQSH